MEIKSEPEEHVFQNSDSIDECAEYSFNETNVKTESKEEQTQSDIVNKKLKIESSKNHECNICFKSFKEKRYLTSHIRTHTGERPYICNICAKAFKERKNLTSHMKTHTGVRPYSCNICAKAFFTSKHLKQHMMIHNDERNFQCDECGVAFKTPSNLKIHRRVHTGERPYKCDECPETFSYQNVLIQHKGNHRRVADFECDICNKTFLNPISLKHHKDWHKYEPQECPECGMIIKNRRFLYKHITNLHPKGSKHQVVYENMEKKFVCKHCGKTYTLMNSLEQHMKSHTGEKIHLCDQCPYSSNKYSNLKVHKMIHTGETPFKCTECHKGYRELIPMKKHMLKIHGIEYKRPNCPTSENQLPELPIPAPKEDLLLPTMSKIQFHDPSSEKPFIKSTIPCAKESIFFKTDENFVSKGRIKTEPHEEAAGMEIKQECEETENSMQCDKCVESFTKISEFKAHLRIHTGEKNFYCDDCGKPFRSEGLLTSHKKRLHTAEKIEAI